MSVPTEPLLALLLGLTGSLGHCVGMCGPIGALVHFGGRGGGRRLIDASLLVGHAGRITTYTLLGVSVGFVGSIATATFPALGMIQGVFALVAAVFALYMVLSLLGRAPSPEMLVRDASGRWGSLMRETLAAASGFPFLTGLVWGFLPCGLVYLALSGAAGSASPLDGGLMMAAFGLGTLPVMVGLGSFGRASSSAAARSTRQRRWTYAAVAVVAVFGAQMMLRSLAAWGLVSHVRVRGVLLW